MSVKGADGGIAAMSIRLDHGEDSLDVVHEINVTPFIEVMLALLVICMIAAPLAMLRPTFRPPMWIRGHARISRSF
jgi:hypothetical protein